MIARLSLRFLPCSNSKFPCQNTGLINYPFLTPILESYLVASEPYSENPDLAILQGFIQDLKEIDKALILLYLDGLSQKEIAEIVGITATNVGSKLSRIKHKLRQKFQSLKKQNYGG